MAFRNLIQNVGWLISFLLVPVVSAVSQAAPPGDAAKSSQNVIDSSGSTTVDENERLHLVFMREEEKLARDVYITLGIKYPALSIFGNITKSEERHTCSVCDVLDKYGITDPVKSDNVGVFSGEEFGWYFTEKFEELTRKGEASALDALYVGAFIEELDMLDINQCPQVIVETIESIGSVSECGKIYTDNADIQRLYQSLLEGSESHLRAYVKNIENEIGAGNYEAQILDQTQVDEILGR